MCGTGLTQNVPGFSWGAGHVAGSRMYALVLWAVAELGIEAAVVLLQGQKGLGFRV